MRKVIINNKELVIADTDDARYIRHWDKASSGEWEPHTFKILDKFLNKESSYIDLGAWIGSTVLYGASIASNTYTAEPDEVALFHLRENISLNPNLNISLYEGVIADKSGSASLSISSAEFGSSGSTIVSEGDKYMTVSAMSFDNFITTNNILDCDLIKMDIEGAETVVLPLMRDFVLDTSTALYLSLHHKFFSSNDLSLIKKELGIFSKFYNAGTFEKISLSDAVNLKSLVALV